MNGNLGVIMKKFAVPGIFSILGLTVLYVGISTKQDAMFMMSAVFLFVAALLSFLYSTGKVKTSVITLLGIVAGIAAGVTMAISVVSVMRTQEYLDNYELSKKMAQQNLSDIRFIQENFAKKNGRYAKTWDEFKAYAETATVEHVIAEGTVPLMPLTQEQSRAIYGDNRPVDNNMTELEAYKLSKLPICPPELKGFRRDTVYLNMVKVKFNNDVERANRKKQGFEPFSIEKLPIIPMSGGKQWKLETRDSVAVGGDTKIPTIRVSGMLPFGQVEEAKKEEISFGNLATGDNDGSWQ